MPEYLTFGHYNTAAAAKNPPAAVYEGSKSTTLEPKPEAFVRCGFNTNTESQGKFCFGAEAIYPRTEMGKADRSQVECAGITFHSILTAKMVIIDIDV